MQDRAPASQKAEERKRFDAWTGCQDGFGLAGGAGLRAGKGDYTRPLPASVVQYSVISYHIVSYSIIWYVSCVWVWHGLRDWASEWEMNASAWTPGVLGPNLSSMEKSVPSELRGLFCSTCLLVQVQPWLLVPRPCSGNGPWSCLGLSLLPPLCLELCSSALLG